MGPSLIGNILASFIKGSGKTPFLKLALMISNNVGQKTVAAVYLIISVVKPSKPVAVVTSRDFAIQISSQCFINGIWKDTFSGILARAYSFNYIKRNFFLTLF